MYPHTHPREPPDISRRIPDDIWREHITSFLSLSDVVSLSATSRYQRYTLLKKHCLKDNVLLCEESKAWIRTTGVTIGHKIILPNAHDGCTNVVVYRQMLLSVSSRFLKLWDPSSMWSMNAVTSMEASVGQITAVCSTSCGYWWYLWKYGIT